MKSFLKFLPAATLAAGLALAAVPAVAQQAQKAPAAPAQSKASPGAIAAAKEILQIKNASGMYAGAVPGLVEKTKNALIQQNLNYQKDLNEIAPIVAQQLNGRQNEIGDGMAQIYASEFTEQELKDLVVFYKSPLGKKLLDAEPRAIGLSMNFINSWAQTFSETVMGAFRAEMRKRGKEI
ncbi:DUF2059 domain-containing protein [Bradyrhizobium sp. A11]|jgi:hypothetical protein|uniref:DUF2059 domain-containing protein n=1 Tax=Bradyrhizobium betae TaxID=244734 RepID=A0AAE9ST90_9BRAD|nr:MULTISPECIES: DUF2059 domain-containing protein [Bradyrhizobium]MDD1573785.1 hypothetical protein [Bradyrhizobium sp. WBOS1]UUO36321.1 hypothetical protein DCK84_18285 [Bradyrhizobium sp. WBOS01]MDD1530318.1 hypothetical protein [Bradyrhizobium sp. WBOS2]MDD1575237.1 hypothetical protein [Bradyrhizobium sp. WBOS7]MDD1602828.1 hypothetical protein [Bradyrhizobium sp. WBOS16]